MRIGKKHPLRGELRHVGRLRLRVAIQHFRPVIQIIDRDEENVWPILSLSKGLTRSNSRA